MAFLFTVEDKVVKPHTETLLIAPYNEIWERDKTPRKGVAHFEFAYIEFMTSKKKSNPFRGYKMETRHAKIVEKVAGCPEGWEPDNLVYLALDDMEDFQTEASTSYGLFKDAEEAVHSLRVFFKTVNLAERNKAGMAVYKPTDITRAVADTSKTLKAMKELEDKVFEELYEETRTQANKRISPLADPRSLIG